MVNGSGETNLRASDGAQLVLSKILGHPVDEQSAGTIGVAIALAELGTDVLRVHDVRAVHDALVARDAIRRVRKV